MKLLISDNHGRDHGFHASIVEPIKRRNLQLVLDEWGAVVDRIIITGDFFDKPDPSHFLVSQYAEIFKSLGENISKVVFLVGNHDPIFKSSHALSAFQKGTCTNGTGMRVVTGDEPYFDYEVKAVYQAWTKGKLPKAPASDSIGTPSNDWDYFGHLQVKDWIKFSNDGYSLDEIKAMGFRCAYLGDFHPHRDGGKVVSIGTFGASDFRDEGLDSGYIIANDNGSFTRHRLEHPIFKTIDVDSEYSLTDHFLNERPTKGNIIKVRLHGSSRELTNKLVESTRRTVTEDYTPLHVEIEKVYTQKDKVVAPKIIGNLDELIDRHKQTWSEGSKKEYELLQRE